MLKYRRAESYMAAGPPAWTWQDVIVLKPGEEFPVTIEALFREAGAEQGMWGSYAHPYERMLIEAGKSQRKRQTGWMTRIHPLVLPGGRILLPLYSDGFNLSLVALSDDLGETWRASRPIVGLGPIQPTLVRRSDGSIVAYMRDSGDAPQRVQTSISTDEGESWSFTTDIDIPNPSSSLEVICLTSGEWLMVANDTEEGRHQLAAIVSEDEGRTWPRKRYIEPAAAGSSFAYPSVIQSQTGLVHVTYSVANAEHRACIRHRVLTPEWLRGCGS